LQVGTDHGAPACNRPVAAPARTSPVRRVLRQEAVKGAQWDRFVMRMARQAHNWGNTCAAHLHTGGANSTSTASCQGVALDSSASPSTGNLLSGGRRGALVTALLAPATLGCLAGALPAAAVATASPLDVPEVCACCVLCQSGAHGSPTPLNAVPLTNAAFLQRCPLSGADRIARCCSHNHIHPSVIGGGDSPCCSCMTPSHRASAHWQMQHSHTASSTRRALRRAPPSPLS
jgi:hypothetical protein